MKLYYAREEATWCASFIRFKIDPRRFRAVESRPIPFNWRCVCGETVYKSTGPVGGFKQL